MRPPTRTALAAIAAALGLALAGAFWARAAEEPTDPHVNERDKEVKRGDKGAEPETPKIDWESDEEIQKKAAEETEEIDANTIKITSRKLEPPEGNWSFKTFEDDPSLYVEVVVEAEQNWDVITQESQTIQFWGTAPKDTPDNWPVKAEGNLNPGGTGGGTAAFHWSAKIRKAHVKITDMPGSSDKTIGGEDDKKWTFAKLPPPYVDPFKWSAESSETNAAAEIRYKRGSGAEADVGWDGAPTEIKFGDDKILCYNVGGEWKKGVILVDGDAAAPKMKVVDGLLQIHSVMQGDIIFVVDTTTDCRDRVHVVKDFSLNDMNRRGPQNLALHGDFAALPANLKSAIVNTIKFCLEDGEGTDQEAERLRNKELYEDHDPPLCVLDIPSARGVGVVSVLPSIFSVAPEDMAHLHMASSAALPASITNARTALANAIQAQKESLGIDVFTGYEKASDREKYRKCNEAVMAEFHTLITNATNDATNPFHVYHTYELCFGKYYRGQEGDTMSNHDPLRNIRTAVGGNTTLFYFDGSWIDMPDTFNIQESGFFVDRNGKVRLVPFASIPTMALMIEDALGHLE